MDEHFSNPKPFPPEMDAGLGAVPIAAVQEEIRRRAHERQDQLLRGELQVPLQCARLPVGRLRALLGQLAYRRDALGLAVPPWGASLTGWVKRPFKMIVCTGLRWLLIRQVEFNTVVLRQARHCARLMLRADQNHQELLAAVNGLKLHVETLVQRVTLLEAERLRVGGGQDSGVEGWQSDPGGWPVGQDWNPDLRAGPDRSFPLILRKDCESSDPADAGKSWTRGDESAGVDVCRDEPDQTPVHQAYARYFMKSWGPVLVLGCGQGDFVKFLNAEGVAVQGIEPDPALAEHCRERELPVVGTDGPGYLGRLKDDSVAGIYLGPVLGDLSPEQVVRLVRRCWKKLKKGAFLIAETWNPACPLNGPGGSFRLSPDRWVPVELLRFVLESQCFTVVNCVFAAPADPSAGPLEETKTPESSDRKHEYQRYALVGRK